MTKRTPAECKMIQWTVLYAIRNRNHGVMRQWYFLTSLTHYDIVLQVAHSRQREFDKMFAGRSNSIDLQYGGK